MERKLLIASEGMILTNGEAFGKKVWLCAGDTVFNWKEVTEEEAEKMQKELEIKERANIEQISFDMESLLEG